jgi:hypothetical protein
MNKFVCVFYILLFISKTENVFSNSLIYDVNNVEVKGKINNYLTNKKLIESAFVKAFTIFIDKTLLTKDVKSLNKTKPETIKDLVLTYQIIKSEKTIINETLITLNIKFDSKKINNFLAKKKISYADISNISLTILPVLITNKKILLYEENFFYKNWIKATEAPASRENELINYSLALENIEDLEYINNIKENINLFDIKKINSFKGNLNYALVIIYSTDEKLKAFIKTSIQDINIDRNIDLNFYEENKNKSYEEVIKILKKEINQIWKEQNLIDVNTPSFLDFFLEMKKTDDYLRFKSALDTIDVIENYSVLEMTNSYFKIRLKYRGGINKIKDKLIEQNINIQIIDNVWKLKIK